MFLYNIVLYSIRFTFTSRCIHSWASFSLWPSHLFLSGAISNCSPLFPSSILHTFQPGEAPFPVLYLFCLFILSMGFSRQEYWSDLPLISPVDHVLSELSTMTCPSWVALHAAVKSLQSCPTLCNPIDSSPPGSSVLGILQARTLEWVAMSFSNAWKWRVKVKSLSRVRLLVTPWTAAYQASPPMGFSRQEYWSGSPLPSPT